MKVLVTGGAGYIGSHACLCLLEDGHHVTVIDNLCNGSAVALDRVQELSGRSLRFVEGDVRSEADLATAFADGVDVVIHFAALKAVGESVEQPLRYFDNNISGTIQLLRSMEQAGTRRIVFSSSATVYGDPERIPIDEAAPLRATNPYGRSKLVMEQLIGDWCMASEGAGAALLRYFNPVGAHPSGRIGEAPKGWPNNLMPYVTQVAVGQRTHLNVFGDDWPTRDGTGVRDYLHVMDLAEAHVAALHYIASNAVCRAFNLGTGRGYSVRELVAAFESATGRPVPYKVVDRRPGDVAEIWADPALAREQLGWQARRDLAQMCEDAWRWQSANPQGYAS